MEKYGKKKIWVISFVKGVVCPVKNRGEVLIYNLFKTFPFPIFHWAQAAPTWFRDRSHCYKVTAVP